MCALSAIVGGQSNPYGLTVKIGKIHPHVGPIFPYHTSICNSRKMEHIPTHVWVSYKNCGKASSINELVLHVQDLE